VVESTQPISEGENFLWGQGEKVRKKELQPYTEVVRLLAIDALVAQVTGKAGLKDREKRKTEWGTKQGREKKLYGGNLRGFAHPFLNYPRIKSGVKPEKQNAGKEG